MQDDIHYLSYPAEINDKIIFRKELLTDKKMPEKGFAYMYKHNIENMLKYLETKIRATIN